MSNGTSGGQKTVESAQNNVTTRGVRHLKDHVRGFTKLKRFTRIYPGFTEHVFQIYYCVVLPVTTHFHPTSTFDPSFYWMKRDISRTWQPAKPTLARINDLWTLLQWLHLSIWFRISPKLIVTMTKAWHNDWESLNVSSRICHAYFPWQKRDISFKN